MNGISEYHSVELQDDRCKGCTICVTACPVEAIRVHNGKAHILEEKCIDCGECIRVCPNKAKYAIANSLEDIKKYKKAILLTSPTLYTQFNNRFSENDINNALLNLGFSSIYQVVDGIAEISTATTSWLINHFKDPNALRPIISSTCPAVVRLIQVRFPSLIEHLIPLISPAEVTARNARSKNDNETGIFYLSPCPAKMTVARFPLGYEKSEIDKVLCIDELYLPILSALNKLEKDLEQIPENKTNSIYNTWCMASGESQCISSLFSNSKKELNWLSASGIKQTNEMLENAEDGTLGAFDFIELNMCSGGCLGGPLTINPQPVAEALLRQHTKEHTDLHQNKFEFNDKFMNKKFDCTDFSSYLLSNEITPRPSRLLNTDFSKARKMMEEIETTLDLLPGFDCGSCGAPNCRALAEDIVRGNAKIDDCIFIMKAHYEKLLFGEK